MEIIFPVILVLLAGFMFLQIRRQKKQMAQAQEMQDSLQHGVRVQTTSGIYGTVAGLGDGVVDLEIAPGVITRWNRLAVREVVHAEDVAGTYPGATSPTALDHLEGADSAESAEVNPAEQIGSAQATDTDSSGQRDSR